MDERIKTIADHYGLDHQCLKLEEECAELIVALKHLDANMHPIVSPSQTQKEIDDFLEELADVKIMITQAEYFLEKRTPSYFEQYKRNIDFKLDREIQRIKNC